ncbi:DNA/RNA non-specific endonuclease [Pontibacter cellulosilyticus]|uniref:DNA/RNA non-specific endonuclease n=1 Tax=Pontibacter cellulosilyticus TaxID=1720253 RepID=A0A923N6N0_9BACT|nr:DNA/RNA non-specific endonuclease [Pontibacter cellulosilyticus]MBC5992416.1 DNA/RNA non-specific endonuclease [Pontibacter cellulosilyticus]
MKKLFTRSARCLTIFVLTLLVYSCEDSEVTPDKPLTLEEEQLLLGNPSQASDTDENNYLISRSQYALSYSRDRGTPNWVSWHVDRKWLGQADRQDDFRADNSLPQGWYRVGPSNYTGSGFDRGHNTPSADRTSSAQDNSATFLMTNMIPQAPNHNRVLWANLEEYTRDLVQDGKEVYVIMGSYGAGGTGSNGAMQTIDQGRVTVPNRIWKVLLVLEAGGNDLERITSTTRVIAVNTPNSNSVSADWGSYRTSVDAIEQATGYDLLSNILTNLQQVLEARVDTGPTK